MSVDVHVNVDVPLNVDVHVNDQFGLPCRSGTAYIEGPVLSIVCQRVVHSGRKKVASRAALAKSRACMHFHGTYRKVAVWAALAESQAFMHSHGTLLILLSTTNEVPSGADVLSVVRPLRLYVCTCVRVYVCQVSSSRNKGYAQHVATVAS